MDSQSDEFSSSEHPATSISFAADEYIRVTGLPPLRDADADADADA